MRNLALSALVILFFGTFSHAETKRTLTCTLKSQGQIKTRSLDIYETYATLAMDLNGYYMEGSADEDGIFRISIINIKTKVGVQSRVEMGHQNLQAESFANDFPVAQGSCKIQ